MVEAPSEGGAILPASVLNEVGAIQTLYGDNRSGVHGHNAQGTGSSAVEVLRGRGGIEGARDDEIAFLSTIGDPGACSAGDGGCSGRKACDHGSPIRTGAHGRLTCEGHRRSQIAPVGAGIKACTGGDLGSDYGNDRSRVCGRAVGRKLAPNANGVLIRAGCWANKVDRNNDESAELLVAKFNKHIAHLVPELAKITIKGADLVEKVRASVNLDWVNLADHNARSVDGAAAAHVGALANYGNNASRCTSNRTRRALVDDNHTFNRLELSRSREVRKSANVTSACHDFSLVSIEVT